MIAGLGPFPVTLALPGRAIIHNVGDIVHNDMTEIVAPRWCRCNYHAINTQFSQKSFNFSLSSLHCINPVIVKTALTAPPSIAY